MDDQPVARYLIHPAPAPSAAALIPNQEAKVDPPDWSASVK
jgi:hypothetical protein